MYYGGVLVSSYYPVKDFPVQPLKNFKWITKIDFPVC